MCVVKHCKTLVIPRHEEIDQNIIASPLSLASIGCSGNGFERRILSTKQGTRGFAFQPIAHTNLSGFGHSGFAKAN